jgi:phenylpropionate dioxygenase-like ring-hydroxylating dioxygenase large terminal subunit
MSAEQLERTLPTAWYRSPDIFQIEKERIFCREWFAVCRDENSIEEIRKKLKEKKKVQQLKKGGK